MSDFRTDNYPSPPQHTSNISTSGSPLISTLTLNCQSLLSKRESFMNIVNTYPPNINVGSESWLKPDILSSEVFPGGYNVYRKDHSDGYGGVFLACHQSLISYELDIPDSSSELCACQINLPNNLKLIVCSVYRPPSSNIHYLNDLVSSWSQSSGATQMQYYG